MDARPNIKLPSKTHERLADLSDKEGRTITSQIWYLLDFYEKAAPLVKDIERRVYALEKHLK